MGPPGTGTFKLCLVFKIIMVVCFINVFFSLCDLKLTSHSLYFKGKQLNEQEKKQKNAPKMY